MNYLYYVLFVDEELMSAPQNVKVQPTVEGYLVTWDPPSTGANQVRLYTVKWFRGPIDQLYGRAETSDTFYLGNFLHLRFDFNLGTL